MTVQELINILEKVENKNLKIVVKGTDPTDWTYYNKVKKCKVENVGIETKDDVIYRKRFVIDGGIF